MVFFGGSLSEDYKPEGQVRKSSKTATGFQVRQYSTLNVVIIIPGCVSTRLAAILNLDNHVRMTESNLMLTVAHSKQGMGVAVFLRQ